ncbi:MAG: LacI family transcriptional regulator, partial [Gaiellales bacterium]|nr:LacI family transcriptional regulator [Gaiellales bacterium]
GNDLVALGVLKAARELGLRVPEDLAVAGFDDFEFAAAVDPPLTTVRIPGYEMGRQAARSLLRAVESGAPAESSSFPVEVRLRGST